MATKAHKLLTGTDLHEPKGVETASAGQVYVSDGAGSGSWQSINVSVTASTGDVKLTLKTVADNGWIMMDDTSIGSALSSAVHKSDTYRDLFILLWTVIPPAWSVVTPSRGGSAAADWVANKAIRLPPALGRALAVAGQGFNLSNRALGQYLGTETQALTEAQLPPHAHNNTLIDPGHIHGFVGPADPVSGAQSGPTPIVVSTQSRVTVLATTGITIHNANAGSGQAHNNMQPTLFLNVMIKV